MPFYTKKGGFIRDDEAFPAIQFHVEMIGKRKSVEPSMEKLLSYSHELCWLLWDVRYIIGQTYEQPNPDNAESVARRRKWPLPKAKESSADYLQRIFSIVRERSE